MSAIAQIQTEAVSPLVISPLQPTIGAEISGVDLRYPLTPALRDEIKATLLKYKVVFFRDQDLDQNHHAAFARQFGPLYTHPSTSQPLADQIPAIHRISSKISKIRKRNP